MAVTDARKPFAVVPVDDRLVNPQRRKRIFPWDAYAVLLSLFLVLGLFH